MADKRAISEFIIEKANQLKSLSADLSAQSNKVIEKSNELNQLSKQLRENLTNSALLKTLKINQSELSRLTNDLKSSQENLQLKQAELKTLTSLL